MLYRILFFLSLLLIPFFSLAGELVRHPDEQGLLFSRLQWAHQAASGGKTFWIGYAVTRLMDPDEIFMTGVSIHGKFDSGGKRHSLQEWIYGTKPDSSQDIRKIAREELERAEKQNQVKVWKQVGIFQRFHQGSKLPDRTQVMNLAVFTSFDAPLYWLGEATHEESFAYLSGMYSQMQTAEHKEDLMGAIGMHPPAMAFPFLKKILTSREPEQAQEAAAIFIGETETDEALQLLEQVTEQNPGESVREAAVVGIAEMKSEAALQTLAKIARSHSDQELRETALAMLADKKSTIAIKVLEEIAWFDPDSDIRETAVVMLGEQEAGVPALLKIMDEHPSEDTREIAVHILAETVAGRKVLKAKIK